MSEFEVSIPIDGSDYNDVLIINKRGDKYQLILGRNSKKVEGTVMWQMCYPQFNKKPRDVAVPWNIPLGNREQAIHLLKQALAALYDQSGDVPKNDPVPKGEDQYIPF